VSDLIELARQYHVLVKSDNDFKRQARVLQSMWRESRGYPIGAHRGQPLGSRLAMPWAKETLANYLTETIREVFRAEVLDNPESTQQVFQKPRVFRNLLSSQPLCFNLFGELQQDLALATRVMEDLAPTRIAQVNDIRFEYSPGRGDPRYTDDHSAFDVYLEFRTPRNKTGFVGIEMKYTEELGRPPARHRTRYDEVAGQMGCFKAKELVHLKAPPLEQIWRDHLLAGSLRIQDGFDDGFFALVYPSDNGYCARAVSRYRECLRDSNTFVAWHLEDIVASIQAHTDEVWIQEFFDRYLDFGKLRTE